jgi:hypothetical protein
MIRETQEDSTGIVRKLLLTAFTPGELHHFRHRRPNIRPDLTKSDVTQRQPPLAASIEAAIVPDGTVHAERNPALTVRV